MTPIVIAGHSHTNCLGLIRPNVDGVVIEALTPPKSDLYGLVHQAPPPTNFAELIGMNSDGMHLALLWQGNYHLAKYLFVDDVPFDFVLSSAPEMSLHENASLLPEALVEAGLRPAIGDLGAAIRKIRHAGSPASITVVSAPPPKPDDDFIRVHLRREFATRLSEFKYDESTVELTPPSVRLKLWRLFMDMQADMAARLNASFLKAPPECLDESGFLARRFWADDVTHANLEYGGILLSYISRSIRLRGELRYASL